MSGLDTSQQITDEVSLHAEEFHVHSHPETKAKEDASDFDTTDEDTGEPDPES